MRPSLSAVALVGLIAGPAAAIPPIDDHIKVDQFGYEPDAAKFSVISDPVVGFNAGDAFTPGSTYEVRRVSDDGSVFSGPVAAWNGGAVHDQSGDRAYTFDFTSVSAPGEYYVYDAANDAASNPFRIADGVYAPVLVEAMRTYYYQRCGVAKAAPHAHPDWRDEAPCHQGAAQDTDCRAVGNPTAASSRDLSGGWHDAGDYNKYVNFADDVIHDLLFAYSEAPGAWSDGTNIPESLNGLPDVLDEIKWELDWFLRMQEDDGSVLHKVSVTGFEAGSPPSTDTAVRRYAPVTASATVSACGAFAHAAWTFGLRADGESIAYAAEMETAAVDAWTWLDDNPDQIPSSYQNDGFANATAEDDPYWQFANRVVAAVYLFARTGDPVYRTFVDANAADVHLVLWGYAYEFEVSFQDALLAYAALPGATPSVASAIRDAYVIGTAPYLDEITDEIDAYRAPMIDSHYGWGSNREKAHKAELLTNLTVYDLDPASVATQVDGAAGFIHYMHGVNPLNLVYLTNMEATGSESSCTEMYHGWFFDGTVWDSSVLSLYGPAPGFVTGGVNPTYSPDPAYSGPPISPPQDQPHQKSYLSWNTSWPENSWEVTENSITYQSAYVRLLARFSGDGVVSTPPTTTSVPSLVVRVRPNPVRTLAAFTIDVPDASPVSLRVFDVSGRLVDVVLDEMRPAGRAAVHWDGSGHAPGLYFYRAETSRQTVTGRMVIR